MKKIILIACLTILPLLGVSGLATAADNQISFSSIAEIEVTEVAAQGKKILVRKPAVSVPPGDIVIYTNTYTNHGDQAAEALVLTNPVPENTAYLGGSATEEETKLMFSVDAGERYALPGELFVTDKQGKRQPAQPSDYTHIQWQILTPLPAGKTGVVEFRVRVL